MAHDRLRPGNPRDAIHIAVMNACDIGRVMSFDRGFDGIPVIQRLEYTGNAWKRR